MQKSNRIGALSVAAVVAVVFSAQPAWAMRTRAHELAESPYYKQKTVGMLGRGVINGVTCFVDLLVNTVNETRTGPPLIGTLTGLAKGTGCGVLRLGSGVIDIGTFWVPGFNGFPVSDSYENCVEPAAGAPAYNSTDNSSYNAPVVIDPNEAAMPVQTPAVVDNSGSQAQPSERKWSK